MELIPVSALPVAAKLVADQSIAPSRLYATCMSSTEMDRF